MVNKGYTYNTIKKQKPKDNKEAMFKGKNIEYSEVLVKIRKNWKDFFKTIIPIVLILAIIVGIFLIRRYNYYKEYKKGTWYVETAYLESSHEYTETDTDSNGSKITRTKYKRFYKYTGKDKKEYTYQQSDFSTEGEKGEELKIFVDLNDNSEYLEIKTYDSENKGLIIVCSIILGPIIVIFFIVFLILYIRKYNLKRKIRKLEKEIYNN